MQMKKVERDYQRGIKRQGRGREKPVLFKESKVLTCELWKKKGRRWGIENREKNKLTTREEKKEKRTRGR